MSSRGAKSVLPMCHIASEHLRNAVTEAIDPNGSTCCRYISAALVCGLYTTKYPSNWQALSDKGTCLYAADKSQHFATSCGKEHVVPEILKYSEHIAAM